MKKKLVKLRVEILEVQEGEDKGKWVMDVTATCEKDEPKTSSLIGDTFYGLYYCLPIVIEEFGK